MPTVPSLLRSRFRLVSATVVAILAATVLLLAQPPRPVPLPPFVGAPPATGPITAGTPTLIQSVATGQDQNPATTLDVYLPQVTLAQNAAILGLRYNSAGTITSIGDDGTSGGNTWTLGPSVTGSGSPYGTTLRIYYVTNAKPFRKVTVAWSGISSATCGCIQANLSEWTNIALVSAADGQGTSATSRTTSAFTTTATNDLVWELGAVISDFSFDYGTL